MSLDVALEAASASALSGYETLPRKPAGAAFPLVVAEAAGFEPAMGNKSKPA